VIADGRTTTEVAVRPKAELGRSVLTHEAVAALVSQSPEERYLALVATAGLEIPDIGKRIDDLVSETKAKADRALESAGMAALPRRNRPAIAHLEECLDSSFAKRLPRNEDVEAIEQTLASATNGRFHGRAWPITHGALEALVRADGLARRLVSSKTDPRQLPSAAAFDDALQRLEELSDARREARSRIDALITGVRTASRPVHTSQQLSDPDEGIPVGLAVRWLSHAESLQSGAEGFVREAKGLRDQNWAALLVTYAQALQKAVEVVPQAELTRASRAPSAYVEPRQEINPQLFRDAGFDGPISDPAQVLAHLEALSNVLAAQLRDLDELANELQTHPARTYGDHAAEVLEALCNFELARTLKLRSPTANASEAIVSKLLQGRLAPAVRELVAAMVRFEWYFKPLIVPEQGRTVVLAGLATSQSDLDARLLLNSAERTVLGLSWFLALHLLQVPERRRVLVLDDPTAAFDGPNEAGFISTLRAFVRLLRPEQVVVSTHNDSTAGLLVEQLAPVDGWPVDASRVRVQRDAHDASVATEAWVSFESASLATDERLLGLMDDPAPLH
jgi:hypothetical protein